MTDPVEVMARALYRKIAWAYKWNDRTPYDRLNEHALQVLDDTSQSAINALKEAGFAIVPVEPTKAIEKALTETITQWGRGTTINDIWKAAIAAAQEGE